MIKLGLYLFIRGGRSLYEFHVQNMHFPSAKTISRHSNGIHGELLEGHYYFNELKTFLIEHKLPLCVSITEDGTKIVEVVEYDCKNDILIGLVAPFDNRTGMVLEKHFSAKTAEDIKNSIENSKIASYVYVLLARSIHPGIFLI